jgi:hypothetical protein
MANSKIGIRRKVSFSRNNFVTMLPRPCRSDVPPRQHLTNHHISANLRIRLYWKSVPTARSCSVSFTDTEGISHSVDIAASSLFEAAVLAMAEFRRHGFADATCGPGTKLTVKGASAGDVARGQRWSVTIRFSAEYAKHSVINETTAPVTRTSRCTAPSTSGPSRTL